MAATDQNYRSQRALDIVFGVTCLLMLISVIGMFAQDQYRDWKVEQRKFRDVESALADRGALRALPNEEEVKEAEEAVRQASEKIDKNELDRIDRQLAQLLPKSVKAEAAYNAVKADFDSASSLYNIAVDE